MRTTTFGGDPLDAPDERASELDFAAMARAVWAKKLRVLIPVLLALVGAVVAVQWIAPEYKSTASILLQSQESSFTRPLAEQRQPTEQQAIDDQAVGSQVQLLKSRDVARQAVKQLALIGDPEFDPLASGIGPVKKVLMSLGLMRNPYADTPEDRVLDKYFAALTVYPMDKSRVLTIEFASRDPDLAARAANTIADIYIDMQRSAKRGESQGASDALSPQIEELRKKVATAEAAVETYRTRNGLFAAQNNASLSTQQLADITAQLSSARAQQTEAEAKANLLREMIRTGRPVEVSDVSNNETVRRLVEQRAGLVGQLALEQQTLLPGHPRIKELKAQLAAIEAQIVAQAQKAVRTLENDAGLARARVQALTEQLNQQKGASGSANANEVELRALEREAKAQRDLLESYLSRFREASARASFQDLPADARIISRAVPASEPYFPKKIPIIVIATLAALILSLAFLVSGELLGGRATVPAAPRGGLVPRAPDTSVADRADAAGAKPVVLPATVAAVTPSASRIEAVIRASRGTGPEPHRAPPAPALDPVTPAIDLPAAAAENLRRAPMVTTPDLGQVLVDLAARCRKPIGKAHCLVFTGSAERGAISAAASELGRALSGEGKRVVLVNLRAGQDDAEPGLGDLLAGASSFVDVIERDVYSRLHLIAAGRQTASRDGEAQARLEIVAHALSVTYEVVLFDAGPFGTGSDAPEWQAILPSCEAAVAIVAAGSAGSRPGTLADIARALAALGVAEIISAAATGQDRAAA